MNDFVQTFEERLQEIEAYLELLKILERQVQEGLPRIGESRTVITVQQQRILYSSVYLQLYNLVESTITRCLDAVTEAAVHNQHWRPGDLSVELRREWVRSKARTHVDLSYENRLQYTLELCEHLVQALPLSLFRIERGGGGNWDDEAIYEICKRLGLPLRITTQATKNAKQPFRNAQGSLTFIKTLRNDLAHGTLSFAECGDGVTVSDLLELKERISQYLREVVGFFKIVIDTYEFLLPARRPQGGHT